jgi:selenide,water dikinase
MQQVSEPVVKDLVLIGGGHSHAIALRKFGMNPLPGVRLTLITETSQAPYSGMLPGHVAGFYDFDQCHIDLRPLAQFAQAQLYLDQAIGLDLETKRVLCANRPPVGFDLLSIDIGSHPTVPTEARASAYSLVAKPVHRFLEEWHQLVEHVAQVPQERLCLGIVGGGTGGVELSLAIQHRLHQLLKKAQQPTENLEIHLFHRGVELMPGHSPWVQRRFHQILTERGIQLHLQETVSEVQQNKVKCKSGLIVTCATQSVGGDYRLIWVTQASAPSWIQTAGLATDSQGFILVQDTLQSVSHPQVFAAGDIATMINHPRPKAGVFAVRQGEPLFRNLYHALLGKPLKPYKPQKRYLSLIGTSELSAKDPTFNTAVASWGSLLGWQSPRLWRWKDWIDRRFMEQFRKLPQMVSSQATHSLPEGLVEPQITQELAGAAMRCGGCGSKVGSSVLKRVLGRINLEQSHWHNRADILIGLDAPDDAAVVEVPAGQLMVHTLDYFRDLINDPFVFGQISANHCLSDLFAMGATPQSGLAIASIPYSLEAKQEEILYQLLSGATKVLAEAGAPLVGGHTTEGAELAFGLSCNGLVDRDRLLRKSGMQPGQVLILTKALGTGTLFAADMRWQAKGYWIDHAILSMLLSNQAAATCLLQHQATACTDVTGFGLLGHLIEMIQASGVAVELNIAAIPILEGALETLQRGIVSSLQPQNLRVCQQIHNLCEIQNHPHFPILFDPQTSGGLLATIPEDQAHACLTSLKGLGYSHTSRIGRVVTSTEGIKPLALIR